MKARLLKRASGCLVADTVTLHGSGLDFTDNFVTRNLSVRSVRECRIIEFEEEDVSLLHSTRQYC